MAYPYIPAYTKEDAESFNKLINRYMDRLKNHESLIPMYEKVALRIKYYLDTQDYYKYILEWAKLIDEVEVPFTSNSDNNSKKISYDWFLHMPLDEMPLYINGTTLIHKMARWRLSIGK